jgi:hypothetical protein
MTEDPAGPFGVRLDVLPSNGTVTYDPASVLHILPCMKMVIGTTWVILADVHGTGSSLAVGSSRNRVKMRGSQGMRKEVAEMTRRVRTLILYLL